MKYLGKCKIWRKELMEMKERKIERNLERGEDGI
jgi:hypothetical protein